MRRRAPLARQTRSTGKELPTAEIRLNSWESGVMLSAAETAGMAAATGLLALANGRLSLVNQPALPLVIG
jgi:hypothetical protein